MILVSCHQSEPKSAEARSRYGQLGPPPPPEEDVWFCALPAPCFRAGLRNSFHENWDQEMSSWESLLTYSKMPGLRMAQIVFGHGVGHEQEYGSSMSVLEPFASMSHRSQRH